MHILLLNNDSLSIIYSFVGPKSLYLSRDFFLNYYQMLKKEFVDKPIKLKYQLIRWKNKFYSNYQGRPSMLLEEFQDIEIKGGIYLGKIDNLNSEIYFSKKFEDLVIPTSTMKMRNAYNYCGIVIYWSLRTLICVDTRDRLIKYNLLWNNF